MRWPLRNQILLPFSLVLLIVVALVSGLAAWFAAQRSGRQIELQMRAVGQELERASFPLTTAILEQAKALSGADFVMTDEDGAILASTVGNDEESRRLNLPSAEKPGVLTTVDVAGERYFHSAVRPRRSEGRSAWLHLLYPEHAWREARYQAALPPLLVGLGAIGVVIAVSFSIAQQLSRPLHQLQVQVGRIASGNFEELPLPDRDDEIRDLAVSTNSLVRELVGMKQAIQRSERLALIGQLSGGLAHHLRNAITGARLATQLHARSCASDDQESLQVADRQLRLAEEQLQRFLTAGQPQTPKKGRVNIADVVAEVALLVRPLVMHHGLQLTLEMEAARDIVLHADRELLQQMLLNLVLNAIDAAGPGGWIRISAELENKQRLVLGVSDSGPGPPEHLRPQLFEAFATGKPEGIGLGLAASRRIAQAHEGELVFAGDQPTRFEFRMKAET